MPQLHSKFFGTVSFDSKDLFHFDAGIPGFESETQYVGLEMPGQQPILYLQSTRSADLCLITLPVLACLHSYQLQLAAAERFCLGLDAGCDLKIGDQVGCFAIVTVDEHGEPTANLAAPLVVNLATRQCLQSFQPDVSYSFRHPLIQQPEPVATC